MRRTQEQKVAFLLDEIGNVSDAFLQETMQYRRSAPNVWRILTAIACSLLIAVIGIGTLGHLAGSNETPQFPQNTPSDAYASLDAYLCGERDTLKCEPLSHGVPSSTYFEEPRLILQYEDGAILQSRALTPYEVTHIQRLIAKGTSVGDTSPKLACRVWMTMGDGTVISPYLKPSPGNVGNAMLFDYDAELLPSEELISYLSDILNS
jgi:hypothetical protein